MLELTSLDYKDIKIDDFNAVVYLDPPYWNTDCDAYNGIDFSEFCDWINNVNAKAIYISHYRDKMLDDKFGLPHAVKRNAKSTLQSGTFKKLITPYEAVYKINK